MTSYNTVIIENLNIFYREAGSPDAPAIILFHGFSSSSHYYRNLILALSDKFHLVAPDYPGFGNSDCPDINSFNYTFDNLAEVIEKFLQALGLNRASFYIHGYGAPVGLRIASKRPEWIETLIIQNGKAYEEGPAKACDSMRALWGDRNVATEAEVLKVLASKSITSLYTHGTQHPENISPDAWNMDQYFLGRPGNQEIQLELLYDYQRNLACYEQWHAYFREHQPPTLVAWGKNDPLFGIEGALAYERDLKNIEIYLLETGHFALEEDCDQISDLITCFLAKHTKFLANHPEYRERCKLAA